MIPAEAVEAAALALSAHNGEAFDVMARAALTAAYPHMDPTPRPSPKDGHRPTPGPSYWDFKCMRCDGLVSDHAPMWRRLARKVRFLP